MASSTSMIEVSQRCGLGATGKNFTTIRRRISMEEVPHSHFTPCHYKVSNFARLSAMPLENILTENSTYCRASLKHRLIRDGILDDKNCSICHMDSHWHGKPLVLIIDHINGVSNDNRIENLRLVCPNCNSQLETHGGKHNRKPIKTCDICSKKISQKSRSGKCKRCAILSRPNVAQRIAMRPLPTVLLSEIQCSSWSAVGEKYGVSDNTIRKWAKQMGLPTDKSVKTYELPPVSNN